MRNHWRLITVCGVLFLATVLCAAAEGDHPAGAEHKPALLTFDPGAAIWSIIVFVLLLIALRAAAWKPILRVLAEREQFIEKSIADAKHEREQAARLLADYQARLEKAHQEGAAIVADGRREATVVARKIQDQARREAEEIVARARREIQLAANATLKDLYDQTAELAVQVAGGILRKELSAADHRTLVAESLEQMQAAGQPKLN
jgi:F-type H+-transporting ATPase subunit b